MIKFLDLKKINSKYKSDIINAFTRVFNSGWYIKSHENVKFENEFAEYCGTKYCVGVGNGFDALRLTLRAWMELGKINEGDEVIVPSNTYIAGFFAITENRLTPVVVEPDEKTYNIDSSKINCAITKKTKVIMPVHLYGQMADMRSVMKIAEKNNLLVLEDSAQAHGASIDSRASLKTQG